MSFNQLLGKFPTFRMENLFARESWEILKIAMPCRIRLESFNSGGRIERLKLQRTFFRDLPFPRNASFFFFSWNHIDK